MPALYDQHGNFIADMPSGRDVKHGRGLGLFQPWGSVGGDIWEMTHPFQVQAEYRAAGVPEADIPSIADIMTGAAADAGQKATEGLTDVVAGIQKIAVVLAIGYVTFQAVQHLPKRKRRKT